MAGLDKFYTKTEIALQCINSIDDIDTYDCIVEPSAGAGSFSNQLQCIAYDIAPEGDNIIEQDFLLLPTNTFNEYKRILFIGNPPFGARSTLAKNFIKQSIKLGATTIAFVLPDTFSKLTNQSCFPKDWSLIKVIKLEGTCFTENGKDYYVPCSFYIWTKEKTSINLREIKMALPNEFIFLSRGDTTADFSINGNNGKVKNIEDITNSKAEHYIKITEGYNIETIRDIFSNMKYDFKSSVNGGNAWIGQQDIIKAYITYKNNNNINL